ncbi:MAG: hypothetical protein JWQ90_4219 [Hydrocarboniphaga sp.]|uniref:DUF6918 family protein n=1 Tax=Hydrocarboniphaga sp. TaxID=2033016 RepID=UPI002603D8F4|nr:hypothetical protein [Hydrocarboniphaga sp.]MDB5971769.1 hypothetical protein [Hydrocarboniphaga sp.]
MRTLADILLVDHQREAVAGDCAKVIERHLNGLRSLRGIALRAGLAMFKTAVPDAIPRIVKKLLPDFAVALEPLHQLFRQSSETDFSLFLNKHSDEATDALTGVIDRRAADSPNEPVKMAYGKLRSSVRSELQAVLPELGKTISSYLD